MATFPLSLIAYSSLIEILKKCAIKEGTRMRQTCRRMEETIANSGRLFFPAHTEIGLHAQIIAEDWKDVPSLPVEMFIRSLIVCSFLMGAVFAGNIDKARKDFATSVPSKEIVISSEEVEISTENKDQILEDIDIIRRQYLDLRNKYNVWMEDPYHRNVIAPAAIGAVSALVTMIFLCILFCWCKRCISTRLGYRNLNESQTGWFGPRNASHDS